MHKYLPCLAIVMVVAGLLPAADVDLFHQPEDQEALLSEAADAAPGSVATSVFELSSRTRFRTSSSGTSIYQRIEGSWGPGLRLFMLTERDAGEARLADLSTLNLEWRRPSLRLVAGELRPGFGQWLVFARSTRGGRSLSMRSDSERLGLRSTAENAALRGLAARLIGSNTEVTMLVGRVAWDGRLKDETIISLPTSGIHISATEQRGRKIVKGWAAGLRARLRSRMWQAIRFSGGASLGGTWFERRIDLRRTGRTLLIADDGSGWERWT